MENCTDQIRKLFDIRKQYQIMCAQNPSDIPFHLRFILRLVQNIGLMTTIGLLREFSSEFDEFKENVRY